MANAPILGPGGTPFRGPAGAVLGKALPGTVAIYVKIGKNTLDLPQHLFPAVMQPVPAGLEIQSVISSDDFEAPVNIRFFPGFVLYGVPMMIQIIQMPRWLEIEFKKISSGTGAQA